ncbi:MAG: acyl-CoA/acyl-ACP dehydrogenase [Clostridia bacterium]|nr:acyl-CoA/acyl-ACP dehydrogenase [Clostridia bacterium]
MDFELSETHRMLLDSVDAVAAKYGRGYWLEHAQRHTFPEEMWRELGELGYIGLTVPQEYGGAGMGMFEMALLMERLAEHGVPLLLLVVGPGLSLLPIVRHGSEEQKRRYLPAAASGEKKFCFAITEPDAGTNTYRIRTLARRQGDAYVINGQKVFISGADVADYMLLVARTTPFEEVAGGNQREGLSLFVVDLKTPGITLHPLDVQIVEPERQFLVHFDNVRVPAQDLLGEEGQGFRYLFDGLNPERIMVAAMSVGLGRYVLQKAAAYARERRVFGVPIGAHQGLAHPMAVAKAHVELAALMNHKAAWTYDRGGNAGPWANMAKLAAADAALEACDVAIQVHGGNGFTRDYDLMSVWSLCRLLKTAPVSREMILNYIGEHVLALPPSY